MEKMDPMMNMMYQNAMQSLYNGCLLPVDREILSNSPLPDTLVDPFAAEESDPLQVMKLTYRAMEVWIDEAKKANYFSKHFVQLSKLILNGVTTMGRGLVSLHNRGEDLSLSPMSIGDLIGVASYHFRKSYLGVIQTAKHHPEISERLLMNQLSWSNLLLRLFRTRDRLNEMPGGSRSAKALNAETAADGSGQNLPGPSAVLPGSGGGALPDLAAFFEPAAFNAPHALSSLDGSGSRSRKRRNAAGNSAEKASLPEAGTENTEPAAKTAEEPDEEPEKLSAAEEKPVTGDPETLGKAETEKAEPAEEPKPENPESGMNPGETQIEEPAYRLAESDLPEVPDIGIPVYYGVLKGICDRGESVENGGMPFTGSEMRFLASDPEFARDFPDLAADFRSLLNGFDST